MRLAVAGGLGLAISEAHAGGAGRWADKVIFDPMTASMMVVYFDNDVPTAERMSFSAIDAVHYIPAYEGRLEEASLLMSNGSMVLFSMGASASQDAMVIAAVLGQRPVPQPQDAERIVPAGSHPDQPRMVFGAVDNTTAMDPLSDRLISSSLLGDLGITPDSLNEERVYPLPADFILSTDDGGELEQVAIEIGLQSKLQIFRNCYQRQIQRTPNLPSGQVTVQFIIDEDGIVRRARTERTTLLNSDVENCLVENLKGTQFPLPRNRGTVVVSYPFNFTRR